VSGNAVSDASVIRDYRIPVLFNGSLYVIVSINDDLSCFLEPFQNEMEASMEIHYSFVYAELAELWVPSLSEFQTLLSLLLNLKSMKPSKSKIADAMKKMNIEFNENQLILACSACGETFAVERDLNSAGEKMMTKDLYSVEDLSLLQLSENEKYEYIAIDPKYRCVKSVHPVWTGTDPSDDNFISKKFYHLHPNLVNEDEKCHLCTNCVVGIKSGNLYKYCIANGHDYGDVDRLRCSVADDEKELYRELTVGERIACGKARPYAIMVQTSNESGLSGVPMLGSHFISFPFSSHEELLKSKFFIGNAAERVVNMMKIQFVSFGSKFKEIRSGLWNGLRHAYVDVAVIGERLKLYNAVNPNFRSRYTLDDELKHLQQQNFDGVYESVRKFEELYSNNESTSISFREGNIIVGTNPITDSRPSSRGNPDVSGKSRIEEEDHSKVVDTENAQDSADADDENEEDENAPYPTSSLLCRNDGKFDNTEEANSIERNAYMSVKSLFTNALNEEKENAIELLPNVVAPLSTLKILTSRLRR
jgi:hypothetical protein